MSCKKYFASRAGTNMLYLCQYPREKILAKIPSHGTGGNAAICMSVRLSEKNFDHFNRFEVKVD